MRWFLWSLFILILAALPTVIAVWSRDERVTVWAFLAACLIFVCAAIVLRSRIVAWTLLGWLIGWMLSPFDRFRALPEGHQWAGLFITLICIACGITVGMLQDESAKERRKTNQ